jgi:hypothetical protein
MATADPSMLIAKNAISSEITKVDAIFTTS